MEEAHPLNMETSILIIHTFVTLESQARTARYYQEVKMNFTFKSSEACILKIIS